MKKLLLLSMLLTSFAGHSAIQSRPVSKLLSKKNRLMTVLLFDRYEKKQANDKKLFELVENQPKP